MRHLQNTLTKDIITVDTSSMNGVHGHALAANTSIGLLCHDNPENSLTTVLSDEQLVELIHALQEQADRRSVRY